MKPYYLKGRIEEISQNTLIVETNNLGYQIEVVSTSSYQEKEEITIYLYEFIYEERYSLFGFSSKEDLNLFSSLLSVKGVGPKTALVLFRKLSTDKLRQYIIENAAETIASISEISYGTAVEIVATLKARIKKQGAKPRSKLILNVIQAARNLGFKGRDIEPIIETLETENKEEGEILKELLFKLRRDINI